MLCVHWPARHITEPRIADLKATLEEFPGPHRVRLTLSQTHVVLLGEEFAVDVTRRDLRRRIACATHRTVMAHIVPDP